MMDARVYTLIIVECKRCALCCYLGGRYSEQGVLLRFCFVLHNSVHFEGLHRAQSRP